MNDNAKSASSEPAQGQPATLALFLPPGSSSDATCAFLADCGFACVHLRSPTTMMRAWTAASFDALVIAPFAGWEEPANLVALSRTIAGGRPLLVLTAQPTLEQRLIALQSGADDALHDGADPHEIAARLEAMLRRQRLASGWLECAELRIDLIDRRAMRGGVSLRLPLREFDLLANLARTPNRIVTRRDLLRAVWRIDFDPGTNRVEVHMSRLRAKVDRGFAWPMLTNVRGLGYALRSGASVRLEPSATQA
jgi:two-component system, OmpR family, response regulator